MKAYIDKSALVAELNRLIAELIEEGEDTMFEQGRISAFEDVKVFINHTLEVKDVEEEPVSNDLEREIKHYVYDPYFDLNGVAVKGATDYLTVEDVADIARHFAQWQKEQMITKACNYLFSHMGLFVTFFDDDIVEDIERSKFIKKFRIAMEDKS